MSAIVICKDNLVSGVNWRGEGSSETYYVANGDSVSYGVYNPEHTQNPKVPAGLKYNLFMLTSSNGTGSQAFLVWSPEDPKWQDKLMVTNTVVEGIGVPGPNTLKEDDRFDITVGESPDGTIGVTIDAWRGKEAVCTFSFNVTPL